MLDRVERGRAGAAVVAGDQHHVGMAFGHTGRDRADAELGDELDVDAGLGVGHLRVVDQLLQVLDRIDVMVRRRGDQLHAGRGMTHLGDPRRHLGAGQVAALARLGALGELDLQVGGVHQVVAGHAEARGGDLLDAADAQRVVDPVVGFAALSGVGARADHVHRDGERLVRLLRDRAVAHRAGGEALDDLAGRLDLVDRDRLAGRLEPHQAAQRHQTVRRAVDMRRVPLEHAVVAALRGLLEQEDGLRVVQMVLAGAPPLVVAAGGQLVMRGDGPLVRIRHAVAAGHLLGDLVQSDAADLRGGAGEVPVDDGLVQADRLEQLGAAVAHDGGDAHLAHDLEHAGRQCIGEVLHSGYGVHLKVAATRQVFDGFESQVRVHRCRAIGDKQRHMVDLAHIAGLDHHGDLRTGMAAQQVMLHCGGKQQGRDRPPCVVGVTVGKHQEVLAFGNGLVDFGEDLVQAFLQCLAAASDLIQALDHIRLVIASQQLGLVQTLELCHLVGVEHRKRNEDLLGVQLAVRQQIRLGTDGGFKAGDDFLALPIQRRIGDLCELLGEVVEQHAAMG